ncbi:MAG: hypothetical protein R2932_41820 [Caldilineaceae bacterium]
MPLEQAETVLLADGDLAQSIADADAAQAIVDCVMGAVADLPEHEHLSCASSTLMATRFAMWRRRLTCRSQPSKSGCNTRDRLRNRLLDQYRKGNLSLQTWALQVGQWLLPLLAVLSPQPIFCPVRVPVAQHHHMGCRR